MTLSSSSPAMIRQKTQSAACDTRKILRPRNQEHRYSPAPPLRVFLVPDARHELKKTVPVAVLPSVAKAPEVPRRRMPTRSDLCMRRSRDLLSDPDREPARIVHSPGSPARAL